jgi:hypothetical protein
MISAARRRAWPPGNCSTVAVVSSPFWIESSASGSGVEADHRHLPDQPARLQRLDRAQRHVVVGRR